MQTMLHGKDDFVLNLFSKNMAMFLLENPTRLGFSWCFFFAGILTGYGVHRYCGDGKFVIIVIEKYVFISIFLILGVLRRLIEKRVRSGLIFRNSSLLYLILPAGYFFSFFLALWATHMFFGFSTL